VLRLAAALLFAITLLTACRNELKTREKVQEAIIQRLQASSGLDLKSLDVTTTSVTFDKNLASATVSFHPKSDPTISNTMTMKYTLEDRGGKWVVVNVADSQGHGLAPRSGAGRDPLPAGHPPVDSALPGETTPNPHAPSTDQGSPNGQTR
jgi:hypothetical protein